MFIGEMYNRQMVFCQPDDPIQKATQTMRDNHVYEVVVVEHKANKHIPIGAMTDSKIVDKLLSDKINLNNVTLKYVISNELITFKEDDFIIETIKQMRDKGVRSVPVVNRKSGLEGVLLEGNLTVDETFELVAELLSDLVRLFKHKFNHKIKTH